MNQYGSLSLVIPVYNSESALPTLLHRLKPVLEAITNEVEVILVNDGSRDSSWGVICTLAEIYN